MTRFTEIHSVKIYQEQLDIDLAQLSTVCSKHEADHLASTGVRLSGAWNQYNVFDWPEPIIERPATKPNDTWAEPVEGKLVICAGNLPHYTAPNKSAEPRITISANVML